MVPFSAGVIPSPSENFVFAAGSIPELDTSQMDTGHGNATALSEEGSRELIQSLKEEKEQRHG
ncbi:hypothetical protein GCM10009738_31490 [Kitasatospora viridis]